MKVKGTIKLEITGDESEQRQIEALVDDLKNNPGLSMCKISVSRIVKSKEQFTPRKATGNANDAPATAP